MDSSTGPIAMGLQVQYATGEAPLAGDALPAEVPNEDLIRDFADLGITAAGAVSFMNRQYGLGMSATYLGRTYLTRTEGGSLLYGLRDGSYRRNRVHEFNSTPLLVQKLEMYL